MGFTLLCVKGDTIEEVEGKVNDLILKGLVPSDGFGIGNHFTLSILAKDYLDLNNKLKRSLQLLKCRKSIDEQDGIYFEIHPFGNKSIAFLFPGQGS